MSELSVCDACEATLSTWEPNPCACVMNRPHNNTDITYFIATAATTPLHLRDYVRLAEVDFSRVMSQATANATIAPRPQFCWAGKGLYGLFRHGPLPGPRNLEEAARLLLTASESSLTLEAIEFCLKKLSYRFTSASLYNAINRSPTIEWNWHDGHFRVPPATQRDSHLLRDIPVLPHKNRDQWAAVKDLIAAGVKTALEERATRLRDVNRRRVMNIDWD